MIDPDRRLELLLADADDGTPALAAGLALGTVGAAPGPPRERNPQRALDQDPNDLAVQRWALIAPEGAEGDRLVAAVADLIRLREGEQGTPARVYRVPPEMDAGASLDWKDRVYQPDCAPNPELPRYLLILGDLHQVSLELQHALAQGCFVGRLCFPDLDGYAAYAAKVRRWAEQPAPVDRPGGLFYTARDGSRATAEGYRLLVRPCLDLLASWRVPVTGPVEIPFAPGPPRALLDAVSSEAPAVLLSLSHGAGPPAAGWRSAEDQRARQGAMVLGRGERVDADAVRGGRFLPGGMWIFLACFGAGTPSTSAFHPWLARLAAQGAVDPASVAAVLRALPAPGERPFVAAMPQAALANPDGPLAIIGHVDLSWTYAFAASGTFDQTRASRVLAAFQVLAKGNRAGVALDGLMACYRETNHELTTDYQEQERALARGQPFPVDLEKRGHRWMLRNDLRGYVLLGDPAARLPLRRNAVARAAPAAPDEAVRAEAVRALLGGAEAPLAIAGRSGVSLDTLWAWFDAHRGSHRTALAGPR
jgi:hypothetical protein